MQYLLDTHAWLWVLLDHPRLSANVREVLGGLPKAQKVGLAAISLKEAAWLLERGRVEIDESFGPWPLWLRVAASRPDIEVLPLTVDVAVESERLSEGFPADPADRLIAATARVHDSTLITADREIQASVAVPTLW